VSDPFLTPELLDLRDRTRAFVAEEVIPAEGPDGAGLDPELLALLGAAARGAGLYAPSAPPEVGGLGLDLRACSVVFEEAGYSLLGPHALNCAAPGEGNMHLLARIGTEDQKRRYLAPLAAGAARSCFAMTEPAPGAGSDPSMLRTTATPGGEGWVIEGDKTFISGADGADFAICMARTGDRITRDEGATMFLIDAANPGFRVGRRIPTIDVGFVGGHSEVALRGCEVGADAVLGEPGRGLGHAQLRLGPARLTHCMRWLGLARRALDIALDRAAEREAFGARLQDLGIVQAQIADAVIDLDSSRALIRQVAGVLDAGAGGTFESSVAKVHVSEAVGRVVDRAAQICGGLGVSHDLPLARYMAEVRPFRIYDGASEAHRWSIARRTVSRRRREREAGA
jgi:acyl-CoA dehydrogenase